MGRNEPIEFCGELKYETDNAYLVYDGANEVWIPKSQCQEAKSNRREEKLRLGVCYP